MIEIVDTFRVVNIEGREFNISRDTKDKVEETESLLVSNGKYLIAGNSLYVKDDILYNYIGDIDGKIYISNDIIEGSIIMFIGDSYKKTCRFRLTEAGLNILI